MSNDYFQFRQFTVRQSRCAMKVGTDGTLLGAWATVPPKPCRVLDIGTGTGLVALMLAQRFPQASVTALDIDSEAVLQARENVQSSPFADRIEVIQADAADFDAKEPFDVVVSNPPYFEQSLECPDQQRTLARHAASLTYTQLTRTAFRLLGDEGTFSVVIPVDCRSRMEGVPFCLAVDTNNYIPVTREKSSPDSDSSWFVVRSSFYADYLSEHSDFRDDDGCFSVVTAPTTTAKDRMIVIEK